MTQRRGLWISMGLVAGGFLILAGSSAKPLPAGRTDDLYQKLNALQEIIRLVNDNYVDPVEWDDVFEGAFNGLLERLDPHSTYIPKDQFEAINERFVGRFQGIGIEFDIIDNWITVIAPVVGSPSEHVGLRPGDKIVEIDGQSAYKFSQAQVVQTLRGEKGTSVNIKVRRAGQEKLIPFTIIRDDIPIYSVLAAIMLDERTGYILINRFSSTTANEVELALEELEGQGMTRLLLDLRNNGGGYLEQAVQVLDLFIAQDDTLVFTKGRHPSINQVHRASREGTHPSYPIIMLINRGTASASEIVAGALQDLDRGLIVGETSFGKGLVQRQWRLSDGSALRVTVGRYYTPSGRLIQRPYGEGREQYYHDLMSRSEDPQVQDSIRDTLPRYYTRSGRTVYGGGGIFPDVRITFDLDLTEQSMRLMNNPERLFFQYAEMAALEIKGKYPDLDTFIREYRPGAEERERLAVWLRAKGLELDDAALEEDWDYLANRVASEIAGQNWNRQALYLLRLQVDNQVQQALELFDQAGLLSGLQ
ncbi:MAG: S41 family peptidase [Candidatus Marinimicrobia bacterium]|nr:S41 family peptidase [Candidatus Neomarinimicrobiota bacterium]